MLSHNEISLLGYTTNSLGSIQSVNTNYVNIYRKIAKVFKYLSPFSITSLTKMFRCSSAVSKTANTLICQLLISYDFYNKQFLNVNTSRATLKAALFS